jgi:hypothetical protein
MVTVITCTTVVNAVQTITTANAALVGFNLANGATQAISVTTSRPVLIMGVVHTPNAAASVGQVTVHRIPAFGFLPARVAWTGVEAPPGTGLTAGISSVTGTHIAFLDNANGVDLEVNDGLGVMVRNSSGAQRAGIVTLIW